MKQPCQKAACRPVSHLLQPGFQKDLLLVFCEIRQKIHRKCHRLPVSPSPDGVVAHLKCRDARDPIGGKLQFSPGGNRLCAAKCRDPSVTAKAGQFGIQAFLRFQSGEGRKHRHQGMTESFCQLIAAVVRAGFRGSLGAAGQNTGVCFVRPPVGVDQKTAILFFQLRDLRGKFAFHPPALCLFHKKLHHLGGLIGIRI